MSDLLPEKLPRRRPTRGVMLWSMWGRETVKDFALLFAAIPVLATLMYVPVVATTGGSWVRLLGLLVLFVAIWWSARFLLRRWVVAGDRGGDLPSPG
ncbi:hypothetical protein ASG73_13880 [Janibacter sp. Soil728]|uniref:hypothetical protein n=1 Tax=Janibacter sp. Soil728 TaxID=1736393 RepID=UPI0006FAA69C|nr:hypothetical protein [Janibacter sp. Soil728]KRE35783.1 hypothetical protein ASG73_13880 [Janibacter sp. Soil728]